MAKKKERQAAHYYYVEKGLTAKDAAAKVEVTEKTLSNWVNRWGWKEEREARALSPGERTENVALVISGIAEQRLELNSSLQESIKKENHELAGEIRRQIAALDDGVSKWNKLYENLKKDGDINLTTYLTVMDSIFNAMRQFDYAIYIVTLDFQESHVRDKSIGQ